MERYAPLLALALAASACSSASYSDAGLDGAAPEEAEQDDASAIIAHDAGRKSDAGEALVTLPDAGTPTETAADGGQVALAATFPDWAKPLLGRYATRTYSFAEDRYWGEVIRTRDYAIADFVVTTGQDPHVELTLRLCDSLGEGENAETRVARPQFVSPRTHRVLFGERTWATLAPDAIDGFTRDLPERCKGKESSFVTKDAAQTWIAGSTCRCPSSVDVAPSLEDCRVIDQDEDGKPGSTLLFHPKLVLGDADVYVASIGRSTFVNGTVGADGQQHSSQLQVDQFGSQLGCSVPLCADISATPAPCPPARNKAEFVRVEDGYDCAKLLANVVTLFPSVLPSVSFRCP
ncbi:MAG: hypothetical protein ABW352_10040 [Polyangiales bacterium]